MSSHHLIPVDENPIPPTGWIMVRKPNGSKFWADPAALLSKTKELRCELTDEQKRRIRAFRQVIEEHDPLSIEEAFENFSRDQNPDREITIWERIADVYGNEISKRPLCSSRRRALLYRVLLHISTMPNPADVVSAMPEAKSLPNLHRVFDAWREG